MKRLMTLALITLSTSALADNNKRNELLEKYGASPTREAYATKPEPKREVLTGLSSKAKALTQYQVKKLFHIKDVREKINIAPEGRMYMRELMRGIEKEMYRALHLQENKTPDKVAAYLQETVIPNTMFSMQYFGQVEGSAKKFRVELAKELNYWRIEMWLRADRGDKLDELSLEWFDKYSRNQKKMRPFFDQGEDERYKGSFARVFGICVSCHQKFKL